MFDFVMDWDDFSENTTNLSHYNHKPAGVSGYVSAGADGRLYINSERTRFLGSNITYSSCFPDADDADKIAKRMASFGINLVRWHLMDADWGGERLINYAAGNTRSFNPAALDKFDRFFAEMKEQGIYSNINLLAGRSFVSGDGLPDSIDSMGWKEKQTAAMFNPVMINLQKEYAQNLLAHVNPYTGLSYAEDPAVAFVEVLNEHGLIHAWHYGGMDALGGEFKDELQGMWNGFLSGRYADFASLQSAWGISEPLGAEKLNNPGFTSGTTGWVIEQHSPAVRTYAVVPDGHSTGINSLDITVTGTSPTEWHVQLNQGVSVLEGHPYTLSFSAKASADTAITLLIQQVEGSWTTHFSREINLTPQWQRFEFVFTVLGDEPNARLNFAGMADEALTYSFADFSFRQGGEITGLKAGEEGLDSINIFFRDDRADRTGSAKKDWVDFLWQKEYEYWDGMNSYIKNTLGVKALTTGTVVETSPPNLMSVFDVVDTHGYWQHPHFILSQGGYPWYLSNTSMAGSGNGGTISRMGLRRVHNKPFSVTEYGHPFPNTFSSEANIFLAAYAAFQDWDAIYPYTYDDGTKGWKTGKQNGFFDYDNDPAKMTSHIAAANMFRRGDVAPGVSVVAVEFDSEAERDALVNAGAWRLVDAEAAGMKYETPLLYRCAMATRGEAAPIGPAPGSVVIPPDKNFTAEGGELNWNAGSRVFTVNTERTKAVLGYSAGNDYNFGGIVISPAAGLRPWSSVALTLIEGEALASGAQKMLITAHGIIKNTGMTYRSYPQEAVLPFPPPDDTDITLRYSSDWGGAPVRAEGVNCSFTLPYAWDHIKVYALDSRGGRKVTLPVSNSGGNALFSVNAGYETLWYEVEVFPGPAPTDTFTPTPTSTITPGGPTSTATPTITQTPAVGYIMIDDCDDYDAINLLGGSWYTYADSASTVNPGTQFTMAAGGALSTAAAARFYGFVAPVYTPQPSGDDIYTYAGMGTQLNAAAGGPNYTGTDISGYEGFSFYAKGDNTTYYVKISALDEDGVSITGHNDYRFMFTPGVEWSLITVPFAEMTQDHGWGEFAELSEVLISANDIQWQPEGTDRSFDLWVDEIRFYGASIPVPTATPAPQSTATPVRQAEALDGVYIYPSLYDGRTEGIWFINLPENAVIQVFTLGGEQVFRHEEAEGGRYLWKIENKRRSKMIAPGIYIYSVAAGGKPVRTGKLAIVR